MARDEHCRQGDIIKASMLSKMESLCCSAIDWDRPPLQVRPAGARIRQP